MLTLFVVVKMQLLKHRNNLNYALCMAQYTQVFLHHYYVWISQDSLFQQYQESSFIPLDKIRVYVGSTVYCQREICSLIQQTLQSHLMLSHPIHPRALAVAVR